MRTKSYDLLNISKYPCGFNQYITIGIQPAQVKGLVKIFQHLGSSSVPSVLHGAWVCPKQFTAMTS